MKIEERQGGTPGNMSHRHLHTHMLPGMMEKQARRARMLEAPTVFVVLLVIPVLILHFSEVSGSIATLSNVLN